MKLPAFLLVFTAGALLAADDAKDAAVKKEMEKLQGRWVIVGAVKNGRESPGDELKEARPTLTFAANKLSSSFTRQGKEVKDESGSFTIDPTAKPKTIDLKGFPVPNKTFPAIYELDGDTLKICIAEDGRPKDFNSTAESKTGVLTLKREKN